MKSTGRAIILWAASSLLSAVFLPAAEPVYPIKVSENGRYFIDQNGDAVFWLGTTQWQLVRDFTLDEVRTILAKSKEQGFAFLQVMLVGVGDGTKTNVHGQKPWLDNDPLKPNERYFQNVDAAIALARQMNLVVVLSVFHQENRRFINVTNARAWAKWVSWRYRDVPNVVWMTAPEAKQESVPLLREIAAGLREGDEGRHLITFLPDPAAQSSSFIHPENWLQFNSIQTWKSVELIYPMVTKDYHLKPAKPVVMAEGAYERGSEYGFDVTPLWIRRQAYYSFLAGGHHAYGHNDSWRVLPTWKQALDAPGAAQMGVLKKIFLERKEWWHLVPDQTIFNSGGNITGKVLNLAARHKEGEWAMIYLGDKSSVSINLQKIAAGNRIRASWSDPKNGQTAPIGSFSNTGVQSFSTPESWEDAVLILEASRE